MRKKGDFRKFVDDIRKLFRMYSDENQKTFYENTYVNFDSSLSEFTTTINNDNLSLELKKYKYSSPGKDTINFYRVAAEFDYNTYYNAFLRLNFNDEPGARSFYTRVEKFIKQQTAV